MNITSFFAKDESIPDVRSPLKPIVKWSGGKKDELPEILKWVPEDINIYLKF